MAAGEGRIRPHGLKGSRGESAPWGGGSQRTADGWGWPAGECSKKCGRGSGVPLRPGQPGQGQMVRIAPLRGHHGSGPDALRPRAPGAGTDWRPRSPRSLSPPPRGVWAATSPVHGAPVPRSPPPGRARLLSGSLPPTGSRAAQVPPFLSPFLGFSFCSFLSCWSLSLPFPHSPVRPPRLSADAGVSELLHWTFLASALLGSGWNFF